MFSARNSCAHAHSRRIDPALAANNGACIVFRSGVINAVTDLYGQVMSVSIYVVVAHQLEESHNDGIILFS